MTEQDSRGEYIAGPRVVNDRTVAHTDTDESGMVAEIDSARALSDRITSEPVQVDHYESIDVSDLTPEDESTD